MKGNPAVTAAAAAVGVFIAGVVLQSTDVLSALIGAVVTGAAVWGILTYLQRRKG